MFVENLTSEADYFLVDDDFASINYDGKSVTYTMQLYGRLIQALIDGFETVKLSLVTRGDFRFKYFTGKAKKQVEISNIGFVQRARGELYDFIKQITLSSVEIQITSLLPDDIVSDIGNGKITAENYRQFLPKIEQMSTRVRTSTEPTEIPTSIDSHQDLSKKLFREFGIHPANVGDVKFPGAKVKRDNDGITTGTDSKLLQNIDFSDYYKNYYKNQTNNRVYRYFRKRKAEYQRFTVPLVIPTDPVKGHGNLERLIASDSLRLRVALTKSNIEMSSQLFRFENKVLFEEATAGARKITTSIRKFDARFVRPDRIMVRNDENYAVELSIFEFCMEDEDFYKNQLARVKMLPGETQEFDATKIFFHDATSRAYAVVANKDIPGINGVSNVIKILRPPQSQQSENELPEISIDIKPGGSGASATLTVGGLPSKEYVANITRYTVGTGEKILIGRVSYGAAGLTDETCREGKVYVYTANVEYNGASGFGKATTGFVTPYNLDMVRINFSIAGQSQKVDYGRAVHRFRIVETIESTAASALLSSTTESGEASEYSAELEAAKTDTSVITSYSVYRLNKRRNKLNYLGQYSAGKNLRFRVRGRNVATGEYEYVILPRSTATATLSYRTIVEETDQSTGQTFKYSNKKWRDANFPRSEVLPSYGEVIRNNIQQALLELPEGIGVTETFSSSDSTGRVVSFSGTAKQTMDCTFLSWKFRGNLGTVMHFVIMANYNGFKAPIGVSIPDNGSSSRTIFSYCDHNLGNIPGKVIYSVIPVMMNGKKGNESKAVIVDGSDNYPREALVR